MRMLKDKQLAQPEKYVGSSSAAGYRQWRERFRALISAQGDGVAWEKILDHLEALRELIVTPEQIEKMMLKFHLKKRHVKIVNSNLYHMLQQYTKQTTAERVTLATKENAMDQYRMLYYEGMQVSDHALFLATKGAFGASPRSKRVPTLPRLWTRGSKTATSSSATSTTRWSSGTSSTRCSTYARLTSAARC